MMFKTQILFRLSKRQMIPLNDRHETLAMYIIVIPFCLSVSSESPGKAEAALLFQSTCSCLVLEAESVHTSS